MGDELSDEAIEKAMLEFRLGDVSAKIDAYEEAHVRSHHNPIPQNYVWDRLTFRNDSGELEYSYMISELDSNITVVSCDDGRWAVLITELLNQHIGTQNIKHPHDDG